MGHLLSPWKPDLFKRAVFVNDLASHTMDHTLSLMDVVFLGIANVAWNVVFFFAAG